MRLDQAMSVIRQARSLQNDVIALLPAGCSFEKLRNALSENWDESIFRSPTLRRQHARLLLAVGTLAYYTRRHFGITQR